MNRIFRFSVAILLVGLLVLAANGVWASASFAGTVPPPPNKGESTSTSDVPPAAINMGSASFKPNCTHCAIVVEAVPTPTTTYPTLAGSVSIYSVTDKGGTTVDVCINNTGNQIYKLIAGVWTVLSGTVSNGQLCVTSSSGVFGVAP